MPIRHPVLREPAHRVGGGGTCRRVGRFRQRTLRRGSQARFRDDVFLPVICPTCQTRNQDRGIIPSRLPPRRRITPLITLSIPDSCGEAKRGATRILEIPGRCHRICRVNRLGARRIRFKPRLRLGRHDRRSGVPGGIPCGGRIGDHRRLHVRLVPRAVIDDQHTEHAKDSDRNCGRRSRDTGSVDRRSRPMEQAACEDGDGGQYDYHRGCCPGRRSDSHADRAEAAA